MNTRALGTSGFDLTTIGLGTWATGGWMWGGQDDAASIEAIHAAVDHGVNWIDTAPIYGSGHSETIVGRAVKALPAGRRPLIFTKYGLGDDSQAPATRSATRADVLRECDASLKRLGVDVIDLFYLHRVDPKTPIEDSVGAMAELVREGKVRYLGLSEAAPATVRRAHKVHPISALQSEYSLWWREPEGTVIPVCQELGITFVPFSPLGRGFLSGRVTSTHALGDNDMRKQLPRFQGENFDRNLSLVEQLDAFAARRSATPSQIALAWILAKGPDIVPIPGTKRRSYLESNAAAADIALSADDMTRLESLFPFDAASGERYNPQMAQWVDRTEA